MSMTGTENSVQRRGAAVDEALCQAVGRILHNRAATCQADPVCPFSLDIPISELSRESGLSRPSIYKRSGTIALLEYLRNTKLVTQARSPEATLKAEREAHASAMTRIATEKMSLLARIVELEEQLAHAKKRSTLPNATGVK
jgi:hypothetical protein